MTLPVPKGVRPHPRGAATGVGACLQRWPRPLLGGGEPSPSWHAFPFSVAENLLGGAIGRDEQLEQEERRSKQKEEDVQRGLTPSRIYNRGRPTVSLHDHR